jgi:DedD protein
MAEPNDVNVDELKRRARRRLVGAGVLALAAAVFVPMLLESDPRPLGEDVAVRIPPVDDGKFVSRLSDQGKIEPAGGAAKGRAAREPQSGDAVSAAPAQDGSANDAAAKEPPANESPPKGAATGASSAKNVLGDAERKMLNAAAKAPPANSPSSKGAPAPASAPAAVVAKADDKPAFSVQLAAFADDKGANALSNKLKRAGYPAYTEPLTTSRGTLWRVRVGPFASREAAASSRDKLKGEGYSGIVAPAN